MKAPLTRMRLQQVEETFRLEKEQLEARDQEEALERAEQQRLEEEQRRQEEEQCRLEVEKRRRVEEQCAEECRLKLNEMPRKHDLESLRLRQEKEAADHEEQLWINASLSNAVSLCNIAKSSGNANVTVNNFNQFHGGASIRPESRQTVVNPLQLQQQQIGGLHESLNRAKRRWD